MPKLEWNKKVKPFLMEQFVGSLKDQLSVTLDSIAAESNKLTRSFKSSEAVREACIKLQDYIRSHPFANQKEEITYFKKLAPSVYGLLFYHSKEYNIEFEKQHRSREKLDVLLVHELEATEQFYEYHRDFYKYYYEQDCSRDDSLFIRSRKENTMRDEVEILMGADFCVGCYWAARILANERLKAYLKVQLDSLRNPQMEQSISAPDLKWTASLTDLVELIYMLNLTGSFNNGKAGIKEIVKWFEIHLNMEIGRYNNTWQEIKRRKKNLVTKFIDRGRELLLKRAEEEDD